MTPPLTKNIFGLQMRRTTDLIGEQGREAFYLTGIELDAKLVSIVIALHENPGQSSTELAAYTGLSRQLVEFRLKALEKSDYVVSAVDLGDARKRQFSIANERRTEVESAVETMRHFEKVYDNLWREIGIDMSEAMLKLESALRAKPLLSRLCSAFPQYQQRLKMKVNEN